MPIYRKYLVTHKVGETNFTNAFIISNSSPNLAGLVQLVSELRKTFPKAKDTEIEFGRVVKSSWCKGYLIIRFFVQTNWKFSKEGWIECADQMPDVGWAI